jgi:tyrosinase
VSAAVPSAIRPQVRLRHRRSARRLSAEQLADFREAIRQAQEIGDDRGYQYWAGIHGLPLPISCKHGSPLFLPWHRAYLYFFEKQLQDRVPGVTLPWWDWTAAGKGLPPAYAKARVDGRKNSLASSPIQPSGRRDRQETRTWREPGDPRRLPSAAQVEALVGQNPDYFTFQNQLESIHNGIHVWVAGTMGDPAVAAYDPIFWAHHCMIDRLWYLWQLRHPGAGLPRNYLDLALPPFAMTVRQTLEITELGYDYAATTAAVPGAGGG